jgi:hypothetical protein
MMNTRGMCGGLAYVMVILLFLVASPALQCKVCLPRFLSIIELDVDMRIYLYLLPVNTN